MARREQLQAETDMREWEARDSALASAAQSSSQSQWNGGTVGRAEQEVSGMEREKNGSRRCDGA